MTTVSCVIWGMSVYGYHANARGKRGSSMFKKLVIVPVIAIVTFSIISLSTAAWGQAIQHDSEHYVLLHQ